MYENMYEAYTPYEAERLLKSNPKEFKRLYSNMRHALQRRAKTLESHGRQYTEGYKKIRAALLSADGKDKAKSFSLISSTAVSKNTKYSYQLQQEKELLGNLKKKGLLTGKLEKNMAARQTFFKVLNAAHSDKKANLYYKLKNEVFWQLIETLSVQKNNTDFDAIMDSLFDFIERDLS